MTSPRCHQAPHIPGSPDRPHALAAAVAALLLAGWQPAALAQPSGATVIHGEARLQQQGGSLTVTTANGAGTRHSAIDWRSFSVPGGSTTHFQQPTIDSTSINRVTGGNPSQILGTLSSNGRLVLVNPAGIAVGAGAMVDTAGFTASTLNMSDADALTGRLRFSAGPGGAGPLSVDGRVLARGADVVLLATDLSVGSAALVQAPQGAVIVAAGQRVELTGRGLEGIVFEVAAPTDRVVNLGTLEGDAVGIFASQLQHSGVIRATTVSRIQDKLYLGTLLKKDDDKEKEDKEKAEKEKKEKEDKDKAEKDRAEKEKGKGKG
ncbi:MAG: exoprotein, partial [Ramlibacter sp.]|nr:exoprotein [Ramlibacter sp.]